MSTPAIRIADFDGRLPEPRCERWQPLRAGLLNIWEYDDQRFVFERGRLLLRGRNESGKTKAIEVLLPFLLDADLSPQRLDPFGSTSRPMRWNLLNEGNPETTTSVGYVWLEFGRLESDAPATLTIGAGLRAKRTVSEVDVWYFLTSRRIDAEVHLLDARRRPISRRTLEEAIGDRGAVFDRKREYREQVRERLFELPSLQYDALVTTLLELRRPQLSKSLDPGALSAILTASLPPLDGRVVAPLAEGFERLDRHRSERDSLERTCTTVREFLDVYRGYAAAEAKARALAVTRADSEYQRVRAKLRQLRTQKEEAQQMGAEIEEQIAALERERETLDARERVLRESEEFRSVEALERAEEELGHLARRAARAREQEEGDRAAAEEAGRRLNEAESTADASRAALDAERESTAQRAHAAALEGEHAAVDAAIAEGEVERANAVSEAVRQERREALARLDKHSRRVEEAAGDVMRAQDRHREANNRVDRAKADFDKAEAHEDKARETVLVRVEEWREALEILSLSEAQWAALMAAPEEQMRAAVEAVADSVRESIGARGGKLTAALHDVQRRIDGVKSEHDRIAAATHVPPDAPHWRPPRPLDRPGAPLYLLCEFAGANPEDQATLEAALESSGLLDAWVTPNGEILAPDAHDVLVSAAPREGATLADVLRPIPAGGVDLATAERVLRSIGLERSDKSSASECWVATDGRWRIGPLCGSWDKASPAFIGTPARERERERRLAALARELKALGMERDGLRADLDSVHADERRLSAELAAFPDVADLVRARADVESAARRLTSERDALATAAAELEQATSALDAARSSLGVKAAKLGLTPWLDALGELHARTAQYRESLIRLFEVAHEWVHHQGIVAERTGTAKQAAARAESSRAASGEAEREERIARARVAALREASGATRDELLATLASIRERRSAIESSADEAREQQRAADQLLGETKSAIAAAGEEERTVDDTRQSAGRSLRELARRGLLALAGLEGDEADRPERWSFTESLHTARRIDAATGDLASDQEARDRAENRVVERQQDLTRSLPGDVRVTPFKTDGLLGYQASFNGRPRSMLELVDDLASEVESREALLGDEERELFERFLSGEAHEHLRERLRTAHALVERMNAELSQRPTASGMRLRLRWNLTEHAPPGAREAIDLLLRSGHLLTDADREALGRFLRERLAEAREEDGIGTLEDRMYAVLDYRGWFGFRVEFRNADGGWKALTRKAHGAGSGGQKAVVLHLPLFAAAAAFYESAAPTSPRLIVLDEAFAGIDRPTRAQLMGFLAEFDLDFVMTSYEEWGFYEQLDGLSTYHLTREHGMRGVLTDWFLWNGAESVHMGVQ